LQDSFSIGGMYCSCDLTTMKDVRALHPPNETGDVFSLRGSFPRRTDSTHGACLSPSPLPKGRGLGRVPFSRVGLKSMAVGPGWNIAGQCLSLFVHEETAAAPLGTDAAVTGAAA